MTKLVEWLTALSILVTIWIALLTNKFENNFVQQNYQLVLYSPFILIILFGIYAFSIVLYRTLTFNNCDEAAADLKKEIEEAKIALKTLGYQFPTKSS